MANNSIVDMKVVLNISGTKKANTLVRYNGAGNDGGQVCRRRSGSTS